MSIVSQIVGRLHVSTSDLGVIKYLVSRMKRKYKTWIALPKDHRRKVMTEALRVHHNNRKLYRSVMYGG